MSLDSLVLYISQLCARKGVSLYEIARRNGWTEEDVRKLMRRESKPTAKMLQDLSVELETAVTDLRDSLDR